MNEIVNLKEICKIMIIWGAIKENSEIAKDKK